MRPSKRKKTLLFILWSLTLTVVAQTRVEAGVDIVSSYIWRGMSAGGISVQPGASVSYQNLSFGAWGNVGLESKDTKEIDFLLQYSCNNFNFMLTDYFFYVEDNQARYFNYQAESTSHVFEAGIAYDFDFLQLAGYLNFAGDDFYGEDHTRAYSTYIEAIVPFKIGGEQLTFEIGGTPAKGLYSDQANITNIGLKIDKELRITDKFSIPFFAKVTANPYEDKVYFYAGMHF